MIEKVVNRANMLKAYHQVLRNKGSAGIDGMHNNYFEAFKKTRL
jgi:hypothetical protein